MRLLAMSQVLRWGRWWWQRWQTQSVNRRIFAAMVTVGGLTVVVKLAAAFKELVIAFVFGTSDALDAFLIAFVLPAFVIELIGGSLNGALIPTYIQVREHEGPAAAQRLFSAIMLVTLVMAFVGIVMLGLISGIVLPVLASGFTAHKLALTEKLYLLLLPTLLFCGVGTIWKAVLNAGERFAVAAISPIVTPMLIVSLWVAMQRDGGIVVLALATVAGLGLETAWVGWELRKRGLNLGPRWYGITPAVKQVFRQYVPAVSASFLMGSTAMVAQAIAAMLGPGSVSALNYGSKATTLLLSVGSMAVGTAVLPHFSRMVATGDSPGVRHTLLTYTKVILVVTIPITAALMYWSEPLVRLFLERGAFTGQDTNLVSQVQSLYLLQVPVYVLGMLCVRLISSFRANHILLWGTLINLMVSIVLNYLLATMFQVAGIALAISLMHVVATLYLMWGAMYLLRRPALVVPPHSVPDRAASSIA